MPVLLSMLGLLGGLVRLNFIFAIIGLMCSSSLYAQSLDSRIESCNKIKNSKQRLECIKSEVSATPTPAKAAVSQAPKALQLPEAASFCERLLPELKPRHELASEEMTRSTDDAMAVTWPPLEGKAPTVCLVDRQARTVSLLEIVSGKALSTADLAGLEQRARFREGVESGKPEEFVSFAQKMLTRSFKDPASAVYRGMFVSKTAGGLLFLCGEVNAKNSYGAYVGFKRFYATHNSALSDVETERDARFPQIPTVFESLRPDYCSKKIVDVVD
ncbi:hypothetical protein [Uliginosibacterium sp. TH139]|uniref:hypothetical protein n=1 Tax=Uliginosibacterium sp. TH139 TaxID=2067453 RepID=UPI00117EE570|nr:hypothetical protein [Uliginosibacterium sp. TH139]